MNNTEMLERIPIQVFGFVFLSELNFFVGGGCEVGGSI
jgi:hypothetical protein